MVGNRRTLLRTVRPSTRSEIIPSSFRKFVKLLPPSAHLELGEPNGVQSRHVGGVRGESRSSLLKSNAALRGRYHCLSGFYNKSGERIANLKRDKKELEIQIRREKKASQDYLNNILKEAVDIRAEAAVLKAEAIEMKTRVEASLLEEQRRTSDKIRYERANAASLTKRQRDREAAVSTAKEGALRVARALEHNTWECKYSVVEEKLTRAHIEVLQEREMWEDLRESLLKEKALVEERYYSAKAASRRMMQVQLDKSIEVERILQRDIQELTEHTIGIEKDNKRLERER